MDNINAVISPNQKKVLDSVPEIKKQKSNVRIIVVFLFSSPTKEKRS